jgi:hypothetical protein
VPSCQWHGLQASSQGRRRKRAPTLNSGVSASITATSDSSNVAAISDLPWVLSSRSTTVAGSANSVHPAREGMERSGFSQISAIGE